jgi:hypothetical protein
VPLTLTRSLLTILIPGLVAVAPWLLVLAMYTPATFGLNSYPVLGQALIFAVVAVIGTVCEGLGTILECRWDRKLESELSVDENWITYLAHKFDKEPVGFRYISRLVTSLYFELSMLFAVPVFIVGSLALAILRFRDYLCLAVMVAVPLVVGSVIYLSWQARSTHRLLCRTRLELNKRWLTKQ